MRSPLNAYIRVQMCSVVVHNSMRETEASQDHDGSRATSDA